MGVPPVVGKPQMDSNEGFLKCWIPLKKKKLSMLSHGLTWIVWGYHRGYPHDFGNLQMDSHQAPLPAVEHCACSPLLSAATPAWADWQRCCRGQVLGCASLEDLCPVVSFLKGLCLHFILCVFMCMYIYIYIYVYIYICICILTYN